MTAASRMGGCLKAMACIMAVIVTSPTAVLAEDFTQIEETVTESTFETTTDYFDPCDAHLLRYGEQAGDRKFFGSDDGYVSLIVPKGFRYFTQNFNAIYISTNGLVSLGQSFSRFSPSRMADETSNLIAPLWSDLDLRLSDGTEAKGVVYYQLYEQYTTSDDDDVNTLYTNVQADVSTSTTDVGFNPNLVIVISWKNVPRYPASDDSDQTASFQLILTEDYSTQRSYALFRYGCINIPNGAMSNTQGYSSDPRITTGPAPYIEFITSNIITENLKDIEGPSGKPGSLTYAVSVDVDSLQTSEFQCLLWGSLQRQEEWTIELANIILPPCPCTYFQAWLDGRYVVLPDKPNCFVTTGLNFGTFARMCCYDTALSGGFFPYTFLTRSRTAEAGSLLRYHPLLFSSSYQTSDKDPKQWCLVESENSDVYFRYRPSDNCLRYLGPIFTWMWGDPHLVTTDNTQYSFQGVGEYWLIQNEFIQVQGRASPLYSSDGTLLGGSYWSAIAMTDTSAKRNTSSPLIADKITITMTADKTGLTISSTKTPDIMTWYNNATLSAQPKVTEDATFKKNDTKIEVQLNSGVTVGATIISGQMSISISVPQEAMAEFSMVGLLGKADGDSSNDFTLPNGTVLPTNLTQAQIYRDFGELWRIKPEQSLFDYSVVEGDATTFSSPPTGYEPLFTDTSQLADVDETTLNEVCGDDAFCRVDLLITGDADLAASTKTVNDENTVTRADLQKVVPVVTGPSELVVYIGQAASLQLESNTSDVALTYNEKFQLPEGADLDTDTGLFQWEPPTYGVTPFNMSFGATTDDGTEAVPLTVTVKLCNCTETQGACSEDVFVAVPSYNFKVMLCTCTAAYTGPSCDTDRDYCTPDPCIEGSTCVDQPAEQQTADSPGYNCTNCPSGYQEVTAAGGTTKCQDIDECTDGTDNCTQTCTNTEGGFVCGCNEGYRLTDFSLCEDIDECSEGLADCEQDCINTDGSYNCSCFDGFVLNGSNCQPDSTTEAKCDNVTCRVGCRVINDTATCYCNAGYKLDTDTVSCTDINECEGLNSCDSTSSTCQNTDGSYYCQCSAGYTSSADNRTCTECEPLHWGVDCAELCVKCSSVDSCDKATGCTKCVEGWTGAKCDIDIDECENSICWDNSRCVNQPGTYSCECNDGYKAILNACEEIDDCLEVNGEPRLTSPCEHGTCIDGFQSFTCVCDDGYGGINCSEIVDDCINNECQNGASCLDGENSYTCICGEGYYGEKCESFACKPSDKIVSVADKAVYSYSGKLTVDLVFDEALNDPTSQAYANMYDLTIGRVELVFACLTNVTSSIYNGVKNPKFSPGSVVASYTLDLTEPVNTSLLEATLEENSEVFGSLSVTIGEVNEADISTVPTEDEDTVRLDIILGTIGSLIVVAIIVIMVVYVLKRYNKLPLFTHKDSTPFMPFGPGSTLGSDNVFKQRYWQNIPSMGQNAPPDLASQTMDIAQAYAIPRPTFGNRNLAQRFTNPVPPGWKSATGEDETEANRQTVPASGAYPNFLYADTTLTGRSKSMEFTWFPSEH